MKLLAVLAILLFCQLHGVHLMGQNAVSASIGFVGPCVVQITQAQALTLRNTSGLRVGCEYRLTDFSGYGGGVVVLRATAVNEFSGSGFWVSTAYGNFSFSVCYDVGAFNVFSCLRDNRGNEFIGSGTIVSCHGLGMISSAQVNNCRFDNCSTLSWSSTVALDRVVVEQLSSFQVSGSSGGINDLLVTGNSDFSAVGCPLLSVWDVSVSGSSLVNFNSAAQVTFRYDEMDSNGSFRVLTGGRATVQNSTIESNGQVTVSGATSVLNMSGGSEVSGSATVNVTGGTVTLNQLAWSGGSSFTHVLGTNTFTRLNGVGYCYVYINSSTATYNDVGGNSYFYLYATANNQGTYSYLSGSAYGYYYLSGNAAGTNVSYCHTNSIGQIDIRNRTGGNINTIFAGTRGRVQITGGNGTIQTVNAENSAIVLLNNHNGTADVIKAHGVCTLSIGKNAGVTASNVFVAGVSRTDPAGTNRTNAQATVVAAASNF